MHRYFIDRKISEDFLIENDNFHHIKNVIKLKIGEEIVCIFQEKSYMCTLKEITTNTAIAQIKVAIESIKNNITKILILGIIREQKWDFVLQKATELGVDIIIPVEFKRNVVKIDSKKEETKIKRWTKICEDASEQSYRNSIPIITSVIRDLKKLEEYKSEINLVAWENETRCNIKDEIKKPFKSISIVIGPEGGIEEKEIKILNNIGFKNVTLGKMILRAETAPLFIMSNIIFEKE